MTTVDRYSHLFLTQIITRVRVAAEQADPESWELLSTPKLYELLQLRGLLFSKSTRDLILVVRDMVLNVDTNDIDCNFMSDMRTSAEFLARVHTLDGLKKFIDCYACLH